MPTPADRLELLIEVHGDSLRSAAERCGLDHTTMMRVRNGETVNPATLAKIAEGYGVPVDWMRGNRDLATDFAFSVLSRPLSERVMFLWQPGRRVSYAVRFLSQYQPGQFTDSHLADLMQLPKADVEGILKSGNPAVAMSKLDSLCASTGLPVAWFRTGLAGREDEEEMLVGLAEWALSSLAKDLDLEVTQEELHEAALALVV